FYFEDLFAVFPETKLIIESTVDPLEKYTGWSFEQVQDQMQYGDYNIKASIYVPTFRGQNNSLKPVVTPGDDISENADGNDVVLGWYINQNNEVTRVDMWTELSVAARAPVFAIDGRATNIRQLYDKLGPNTPMIPLGNDPEPVDPSSPPDDANERIAISKLQIGYRYDNNGHSEVEMVGKVVWTQTYNTPTGADPIRSFLRKGCYNNREEHVRIGDVSNYDADNWIVNNTDKFFCWMHDDAPTGTWIGGEYDHNYVGAAFQPRKVLFFNTYELDDSYTSNKALSPEWINGAHVDLKGRMGTYSEWYQFNPAAGQNVWWNEYAMRLHWSMTVWTPGSAWTKDLWTNPIKGMLQFKTTGFCTY
ncbi:hypothetical protein, partial [Fluviicola sp.]|uniref:hypothetical protein n=1 Tax=Fluviicola sp. TaxID=1917219 RepID=UPI0026178753